MDPLAPPAAPTTRLDRPIDESPYWAEGPVLVVSRGATLPLRCVLCNEPAERYVKKSFRWHPPWMYLLILAGLLLYLFVAAICSRRMKLRVPLCKRHATRHRVGTRLQYIGLGVIGLGFLGLILHGESDAALPFDPTGALAILVLGALLAMIVGSCMTSIIKVERITRTHGRFSTSAAFLASCPDHWWSEGQDLDDSDEQPTA